MTEPDCVHEFGRSLSDPAIPRCQICHDPFDQDTFDPAVPAVDPPIRSFDDLLVVLHEQAEAA